MKNSFFTVCCMFALTVTHTALSAVPQTDWATFMAAEREGFLKKQAIEQPWHAAGPFEAKGLEQTTDADADFVPTAKNKSGRPIWNRLGLTENQNAQQKFKARQSQLFYVARQVTAKSDTTETLQIGCAQPHEIRVNGQVVARGRGGKPQKVSIPLKRGINTLVIKSFTTGQTVDLFYASPLSFSATREKMEELYPAESSLVAAYLGNRLDAWVFDAADRGLMQTSEKLASRLPGKAAFAAQLKAAQTPVDQLRGFVAVANQAKTCDQALESASRVNPANVRDAIADLKARFPNYDKQNTYLNAAKALEKELPGLREKAANGDAAALARMTEGLVILRKAMLDNPLLDFDTLLTVKRQKNNLGMPANWQGNSSMNPRQDNELATIKFKDPAMPITTLYRPKNNTFVGDVDLDFDGKKMLFSGIGTNNRWQIFEIDVDGQNLRQVTPGQEPDIDNYDPMYLPDGRLHFVSSAGFCGVPCVTGNDSVGNIHIMNADGTGERRLCYDQDNNWCPTLLPNGRVMFLRWEYTDSAHYFSRVLMHMNPDGTTQTSLYGSNSYWPNSFFYARPVPGSSSKIVGIVTGHHGVKRSGELVMFDITRGRQDNKGAVHRFTQRNKPIPANVYVDNLVRSSWPQFLHPVPLDDKYVLVAAQPSSKDNWGIYLVDTFDNMTLLAETPGYALLEPLPLRATPRPPAIADRVNLAKKTCDVYVQDMHDGESMLGVPPGTVKAVRVYQYEYAYRKMGGHYMLAMEGGWDVRRIIGTAPVYPDGSCEFTVPANTPVAFQPLDKDGRALQIMRSWTVGMPGERISCAGCHERQNAGIATRRTQASDAAKPKIPEPWYGPKRGFSFLRDVQPMLDKYCVGCHDGSKAGRPNLKDTSLVQTTLQSPLPRSYLDLHPYVRRNGPEGDYHILSAAEFHVSTSPLFKILEKGHYGVQMDKEGWDRLTTWVDLNVPCYGTWHEAKPIPADFEKRRYEMKKRFAGIDEDIEAIPQPYTPGSIAYVKPSAMPAKPAPLTQTGWPLAADKLQALQKQAGSDLKLDLGGGQSLTLKRIPAGTFVMGDAAGYPNEFPQTAATIAKPFWMGETEVSLAQFRQFKADTMNGYYDMHFKDQVNPGYNMDADPNVPVIRVSWKQAVTFCDWLSKKTGKKVSLPDESQWEWACRAGTDTPLAYGTMDTDFAAFENLADVQLRKLAVKGVNPQPISNPDVFWDYELKDARFDDKTLHLGAVNAFRGNAFGLKNMHGNVAEWTRSAYLPYPYAGEKAGPAEKRTVRGGSWADRPRDARSAVRWGYPEWQRVFNVGFRVIVEE